MTTETWNAPGRSSVSKRTLVSTGPSGILLGPAGSGNPLTVRLFRPQPVKMFVSIRDYQKWILVFRAASLGAHITVATATPRAWTTLGQVVTSCGGTFEIVSDFSTIPSQGRAYRPSLIVDDIARSEGLRLGLGAWQAVIIVNDAAANQAMHTMRSCDITLASPVDARTAENLRKGYALTTQQLRRTDNLAENELVAAMPRRAQRVAMPPTQVEYNLLFGG